MQIWFYKAEFGDRWDKFISWWTQGPYSHVELVFQDGVCFSSSARNGGARFKEIPLSNHWIVVDIDHEDKEGIVREWCREQAGKKYDWLGTVGLGIGMPWLNNRNKWFCSEIICFVLNKFNVEKLCEMTPNAMYDILTKTN